MGGEGGEYRPGDNPTPKIALFVHPFVGYKISALRGSHGLSARMAQRIKSRVPEGPPTRSWGPEGPNISSYSIIHCVVILAEHEDVARRCFSG